MHILLTGEIQVGKSTIIRKFLSMSSLKADGFMTYWESDSSGGRCLYLSKYDIDAVPIVEARRALACDVGGRMLPSEDVTEIFDTYGASLLDDCGRGDVIVMDELGFLESKAIAFQQAAMRRFDGGIPIIGVIKPRRTEFLDGIRGHPKVAIFEVTAENRNAALSSLYARFADKIDSTI